MRAVLVFGPEKQDRMKPTWFNLLLHKILCYQNNVGSQTQCSIIALKQGKVLLKGWLQGWLLWRADRSLQSQQNYNIYLAGAEMMLVYTVRFMLAGVFCCFLKKTLNQTKHLLLSVTEIDSGIAYIWLYIKWRYKVTYAPLQAKSKSKR